MAGRPRTGMLARTPRPVPKPASNEAAAKKAAPKEASAKMNTKAAVEKEATAITRKAVIC